VTGTQLLIRTSGVQFTSCPADGLIDAADPQCTGPGDDDESA